MSATKVFLAVPMLVGTGLSAQQVTDPFKAPPELQAWVHKVTFAPTSMAGKLQALQNALFASPEQGGLGIVYENDYTRTVEEVWRDRKANCLSLVAFFVVSAKVLGTQARYAEALNTNRWTRVNGIIRFERHVVALVQASSGEDLVADFLPNLRKRFGTYMVQVIAPVTLQAMFFANRAVEQLDKNNLDGALEAAEHAVRLDPLSSSGWNTRGVMLQRKGDLEGAERSFKRALSVDRRDFAALANLEALYRRIGMFEEAMVLRARATEARKKDPFFHFFMAEEAVGNGDWNLAEKHIKTAIKIHAADSEFHLLYARIHLERGNLSQALHEIAEARKYAGPMEQGRYESKMEALKRQQEESNMGKKPN